MLLYIASYVSQVEPLAARHTRTPRHQVAAQVARLTLHLLTLPLPTTANQTKVSNLSVRKVLLHCLHHVLLPTIPVTMAAESNSVCMNGMNGVHIVFN